MRQKESRLLAGNGENGNKQLGITTTNSIAVNLPVTQGDSTPCASCEQPISRPFRVVFAPIGRLANGQIEVGAFFMHCGCAERIGAQVEARRTWKGRAA